MNWTGGQIRRIKANRSSCESRERLIQKQFIRDKELQRINKKLNQLQPNGEHRPVMDGPHRPTTASPNDGQELVDEEDVFGGSGQSSAYNWADSRLSERQSASHVKDESDVKYFEEVLDQLGWKMMDDKD